MRITQYFRDAMDVIRMVEMNRVSKMKGSITLEAALVVPLLLTYFLALTTVVKLAVCEAGLRSAVSQSVHQLAVQAYPITLLKSEYADQELINKLYDLHSEYQQRKNEAEQWVEDYGMLIPGTMRNSVEEMVKHVDEFEQQATEVLLRAFRPLIAHYLPDHMDASLLKVTRLQYDVLKERGDPYVIMEVTYDVPIRLPFYSGNITLRTTASEHIWIGR